MLFKLCSLRRIAAHITHFYVKHKSLFVSAPTPNQKIAFEMAFHQNNKNLRLLFYQIIVSCGKISKSVRSELLRPRKRGGGLILKTAPINVIWFRSSFETKFSRSVGQSDRHQDLKTLILS